VADPLLRRVDAGHPHEEGHGREQEADRDEDGQVDEEERELEHDLPRRGFRRGLRGRSAGRLIRGRRLPRWGRRLPRRGGRTVPGPRPVEVVPGPRLAEAGCPGTVRGLAGREVAEDKERDAYDRGKGARSDDVRSLLVAKRRDVVDRADEGFGPAG